MAHLWTVAKRKKQDKTLLLLNGSSQNKKTYALRLLENQKKKGK
jgi:hypothetical protein